jgi:signal transduction histidine kinase
VKIGRRSASSSHVENVAHLRSQVRKLREQLRRSQSLATLGTMTAMVAHEFNNILTPIINYAQLARNNPALLAKAVSHAADGGKRASAICEALLGVVRRGPVRVEEVNLRKLVEETITAMAREPRRDAIEMIVDVPGDLVLEARKPELQQVILNLLLNARQAVLRRSAPRRIEVHAAADGQQTQLTVRDNGVGIPRRNLPKIFDAFYTTRASGGGSGLGLAFCQHVVRSLGGRIDVHSQEGEGATFVVALPTCCLAPAVHAAAG